MNGTNYTKTEDTCSKMGQHENERKVTGLDLPQSHEGENSSQEKRKETPKSVTTYSTQNETATPNEVAVSKVVGNADSGQRVTGNILQIHENNHLEHFQQKVCEEMDASEAHPRSRNLKRSTSLPEVVNRERRTDMANRGTVYCSMLVTKKADEENEENLIGEGEELFDDIYTPIGVTNDTDPLQKSASVSNSLNELTQEAQNIASGYEANRPISHNGVATSVPEINNPSENQSQNLETVQNPNQQQPRTNEQILKEMFECTEELIKYLSNTYSETTLIHLFKNDKDGSEEPLLCDDNDAKCSYCKFLNLLRELCVKTEENQIKVGTFEKKLSGRSTDGALKSMNNTLFLIFWVKTRCWLADNNTSLELKSEIPKLRIVCCSGCCFCCAICGIMLSPIGYLYSLCCTTGSETETSNGIEKKELTTAAEVLKHLNENFRETLEVRCFLVNLENICCCSLIPSWFRSFHEVFFLSSYMPDKFIRKKFRTVRLGCGCCGACFIFLYSVIMILLPFLVAFFSFLLWKFL